MNLRRKLRGPARIVRHTLWQLGLRKSKPWDGNAIALHDKRAVYYLTPKVACSSLTAVCVDLLGFDLPEDAWKPGAFRGHKYDDLFDTRKRDAAMVNLAAADRLAGYWRFGFVRNPYDRLVSCYSEKIRSDGPAELFADGVHIGLQRYGCFYRDMSFGDFARAVADISDRDSDPHFRSQTTFVCKPSGELKVDFLGKFEQLGADVSKVAEHLGTSMEVPHLLKSARDSYERYYDDATREVVQQRYAADFATLGYDA